MPGIGTILDALIAIPKIAGYVEQIVAAATAWYVSRQKSETLAQIADAAAFAARAQTDEERFQAAERWRAALSRSRTTA